MARSIFAQPKLRVELPWAVGEGAVYILAGQRQQPLIAIQHQRRRGQKGAVETNLLAATEQHAQIGDHAILLERTVVELDQALEQKRRQVRGRKDLGQFLLELADGVGRQVRQIDQAGVVDGV